jgi:hypothetical protein
MKKLFALAWAMALSAAFTGCLGVARNGNPCTTARCESGYHCVPLSNVGFCAKSVERAQVTCNGVTADMSGSCADYSSQLSNHPGCSCKDVK